MKVKNTGDRPGKEVVQLYVSDRESSVFRPVRELKGFQKVELAPGEEKTVTFTLDRRAFAYWNTQIHDWHVESGIFDIEICRDADTVILSSPLQVEGPEIPETFTEDSIYMDIMRHEKAGKIMQQMMAARSVLDSSDASDAASEAISYDMNQAMMNYMPLRGMISFSQGAVTHETLSELLKQMNA